MATEYAPAHSKNYHFADGDLEIQVQDTLFRVHNFHFRQSDHGVFFAFPRKSLLEESLSARKRQITLVDTTVAAFNDLLWFFYESAYTWDCSAGDEHERKWENISFLAQKYRMLAVLQVSSRALDCLGSLGDTRKAVLSDTPGFESQPWLDASTALKRVIVGDKALSDEQGRQLGLEATVAIARAREEALTAKCPSPSCPSCGGLAVCFRGVHICLRQTHPKYSHPCQHTYQECANRGFNVSLGRIHDLLTLVIPLKGFMHNSCYRSRSDMAEGDTYFNVGGHIFLLHAYLLRKASKVFDTMFNLPADSVYEEGKQQDRPIVLQGTDPADFRNLMWFFYDYPYNWAPNVEQGDIPKWESILGLAEKFDMRGVIRVALLNLGRASTLADVRKVALCARHSPTIDKKWAFDAFRRLCARHESLTLAEMKMLDLPTAVKLITAREQLALRTLKRERLNTLEKDVDSVARKHYF